MSLRCVCSKSARTTTIHTVFPLIVSAWYLSSGHRGRFGHEFVEFEVSNQGWLRYSNSSRYRKSEVIRKGVQLGVLAVEHLKRAIRNSGVLNLPENLAYSWSTTQMSLTSKALQYQPAQDIGRQELEIILDGKNLFLTTPKLEYLRERDTFIAKDGLSSYLDICQELKGFLLSLINVHFKVSPYG